LIEEGVGIIKHYELLKWGGENKSYSYFSDGGVVIGYTLGHNSIKR